MTATPAPSELTAILRALRRHALVPDAPGWSVAQMPGGLNSRVFVVRDPTSQPTLTVRQARPGKLALLDHEAWALTTLGGRGCAPWPVQRVDDLLAHAYAAGVTAALQDVSATARAALGCCLAGLHGHARDGYTLWPAPERHAGTRRELYHARLATLERYAALHGPLAARVRPLRAALQAAPLTDAGWDTARFVMLHGDLSAGNLLWHGSAVTLIDWEYSRASDPAEDLAYLLAEQPLPARQRAQLTDAYLNTGGDPSTLERLPVYLPLVALDAALWWADYLGTADAPEVTTRLALAEGALMHADG